MFVLGLIAMLASCAPAQRQVIMDASAESAIQKPAAFIVKVSGQTTYKDEKHDIAVGSMLEERLTKRLQGMNALYDAGNTRNHNYVLQVHIEEYFPGAIGSDMLMTAAGYSVHANPYAPQMLVTATVHSVVTASNGDQLVGEQIAIIPVGQTRYTDIMDILHGWERVIGQCASSIATSLDDIFLHE